MTYKRQVVAVGLILLGLALSSLFVSFTWGDAPPPPPVRPEDVKDDALSGRLRLVGSVPVLRLSGTPREMGYQHGAALKEQILFLHREYYEAMVKRTLGEAELRAWAKATEEFIPETYREEMRGLAEGCGMPYEEVLIVNTMVDRFQTAILCSTVVAAGDATKDGEVLFGRNLDFPGRNILQRMTVVLVFEPEGSTPLVSVTWPGVLGVLSGMNANGIAGATMQIHRGRERRPGLPYMLMYREALAEARTRDDVFAAISKAKRTCANNFMVVDASGAAEVIEFDPEALVRRPSAGGCLCSTNFFASDGMRDRCLPMGKGRYEILSDFLVRERGRIDVDLVEQALADVAKPFFMNVQAMVFLPAKRELYVAEGGDMPVAKHPFVHLTRDVLFGK